MEKPGENSQLETEGGEKKVAPASGFNFTSFREFLRFVEYIGEAAPIEFGAPILDTTGATLIQKSVHYRPGIINNLWKFFNQGSLNENISVRGTHTLRAAIGQKICRSLLKCLEPGKFHVAHALVDASKINIRAMLIRLVERPDLLPLFMKLDQVGDPILPHLGEVAVVAGGFAEQYLDISGNEKQARETIRNAIFAGLLHDLALADDDDFLLKDIEQARESGHAEKSVELIRKLIPGIDADVTDIVEHHHREGTIYNPDGASKISAHNVALEAVALAEHIFVQLRSQYRKDEVMNSAELLFYDLGRAFGQGRFHPQFRKIASRLWESLYATLYFGFQTGLVENRCPHKPSAIAYPSPRCTQIMCHNNVIKCENYLGQFPLEIMQSMRHPGRPGSVIQPGKYAKCKLASELPRDIDKDKSAAAWLEKGRSGKNDGSGETGL